MFSCVLGVVYVLAQLTNFKIEEVAVAVWEFEEFSVAIRASLFVDITEYSSFCVYVFRL